MEQKIIVLKPNCSENPEELIEKISSLFSSSRCTSTNVDADKASQSDKIAVLEKALDIAIDQTCQLCGDDDATDETCRDCIFKNKKFFIESAKKQIESDQKKKQEEEKLFNEKVEQMMLDLKEVFHREETARIVAKRLVKQGWIKTAQREESEKSDV